MLVNNGERLTIWLTLKNRFDYAEFSLACRAKGVEPQSIAEFAQKAGLLTCATVLFPDPPAEAYQKLLSIPVQTVAQPDVGNMEVPRPCGSCGGGKVL